MKPAVFFIFGISLYLFFAVPVFADPTMAFGYLANKSSGINYNYLETIFPNSFANSIKSIFQVKVLKPHQINKALKKKGKELQRYYHRYEIPEITKQLSADYFIYGNFVMLPNEQITINIKLYSKKYKRLFTFSNTGRMETEIFRLVDRISRIMVDFLAKNNYFKSASIVPGSHIGILTNLDNYEQNFLYATFMKKGFRIASIQANEIHTIPLLLNGKFFNRFQVITARENSFDLISDERTLQLPFGTWTGIQYNKDAKSYRRLYRIYDTDYFNTKFSALDVLRKKHHIRYLLIVGFNKNRRKAWTRCLDLREKELIWMNSKIKGNFTRICSSITEMISPPQKKKEPKK